MLQIKLDFEKATLSQCSFIGKYFLFTFLKSNIHKVRTTFIINVQVNGIMISEFFFDGNLFLSVRCNRHVMGFYMHIKGEL